MHWVQIFCVFYCQDFVPWNRVHKSPIWFYLASEEFNLLIGTVKSCIRLSLRNIFVVVISNHFDIHFLQHILLQHCNEFPMFLVHYQFDQKIITKRKSNSHDLIILSWVEENFLVFLNVTWIKSPSEVWISALNQKYLGVLLDNIDFLDVQHTRQQYY